MTNNELEITEDLLFESLEKLLFLIEESRKKRDRCRIQIETRNSIDTSRSHCSKLELERLTGLQNVAICNLELLLKITNLRMTAIEYGILTDEAITDVHLQQITLKRLQNLFPNY